MPEAEVCETCAPPAPVPSTMAGPEDPLDPRTFVCPVQPGAQPGPSVVIEYCDRCRWQPRASWVQTELLLTFALPRPGEAPSKASGGVGLRSVTLIPMIEDATAGRFRVWVLHAPPAASQTQTQGHAQTQTQGHAQTQARASLVWDRKVEGGFPELKQLVRVQRPP